MSCKDAENEEFLWKCNDCQGFQRQKITPSRRIDILWMDETEAGVPADQTIDISEDEINNLLDESDGDSEESEYECDCDNMDCNECYEDASDDEDSSGEDTPPDHNIEPETPRPAPQPTPREPLWTHLARTHEMETQAVGLKREAKMKELERNRRAFWGDSYDDMVAYGTIDTLETVYKRYLRMVPTAQPLEDTDEPSDFLDRMRDQIQDVREARLKTQKYLDHINYRLQQIQAKTSNVSVVMRVGRDSDRLEDPAMVGHTSGVATSIGSNKEETPSGKRGGHPTDARSPPKRARVSLTPVRLRPEQDKMED